MRNTPPAFHRSAGERAFDFCMLPMVVSVFVILGMSFVGVLVGLVEGKQAESLSEIEYHQRNEKPSVQEKASGIVAMVAPFFILVHFCVGFYLVAKSWSDPFARVLRYVSLVLLLFESPTLVTVPMLVSSWF